MNVADDGSGARALRIRRDLAKKIATHVEQMHQADLFGDPEFHADEFIDSIDARLVAALRRMGSNYAKVPLAISRPILKEVEGSSALFNAYVCIAEYVISKSVSDWRRPNGPRQKTDMVLRVAHRALTVAREAFLLGSHGYYVGAEGRLRTLLELCSVSRLLAKSKTVVALRYSQDHIVELRRQYSHGALGALSAKEAADLEARYERVIRKFGKEMARPNGWAKPAFGHIPKYWEIVAAYGPSGLHRSYSDLSHEVHAVHIASVKLEITDGVQPYGSGPRPDGFYQSLYPVLECLDWAMSSLLDSAYRSLAASEIIYWRQVLTYTSKEAQLSLMFAHEKRNPGWLERTAALAGVDPRIMKTYRR